MRRAARPARQGIVGIVLALLLTAATPGDVGGCGKEATLLDRDRYSSARKVLDCDRCTACEITTDRCARACDPRAAPDIVLPLTCEPLFRDGAVCLRALDAASCEKFATYVDDLAPVVPSECDFCRVPPSMGPGLGDGGSPDGAVP